MLDAETRRRIDTARDILVGKVPDPKSQVEQITIALIYKFMDDMDAEAEEFGGQRKFFAGDFARYGWAKLLHSGLGGNETLLLYAEAINRMPENPGIPALFRDIFKNAYLPYRDPETLRAFLKIINEFTYDHSERLGDAFEYLLSVLGSQGDAGQFRTPRHIIDFIVQIVDPKKGEVVLDPACGTAGFLISSYKHILAANRDAAGKSTLTSDEKAALAKHFIGYDISPDMVRLSLVNMYLHGFVDPHIHEYDTLTSTERWTEYGDVILANPPFMSPKGGIRPHNKFTVSSSRSEVLFVDYIAEHLTPGGRAGVIVPEGIIFQSGTAHKSLRKLLVDKYLVAVISLPAGVFNPYSGVKTSILILDPSRAKRSETIGFFKVESDGYGLGAQRRPVEQNDLPEVLEEVRAYLDGGLPESPRFGMEVARDRLRASGEYNLSGERYRAISGSRGLFPKVRLADVSVVNPSKAEVKNCNSDTIVSFVPMADLGERQMWFEPRHERALHQVTTSYSYFRDGDVLVARVTPCFENGKAGIARHLKNGIGFGSSEYYVLRPGERVLAEWLYFAVTNESFRSGAIARMTGTGGLQRVPRDYVESYEIPLPPLDVQRQIVAEIEGYQKVIDGARAVVENYRPRVEVDPRWPTMQLDDLCSFRNGINFLKGESGYSVKLIGVGDFGGSLYAPVGELTSVDLNQRLAPDCLLREGDILFVRSNGNPALVGRSVIIPPIEEEISFSGFTIRARFECADALPLFYAYWFKSEDFAERIKTVGRGANIRNLSQDILREQNVPLPPLEEQRRIVAELEAEQRLVDANRELIARFEKKIDSVLARVWGEEGGDTGAPAEKSQSTVDER